MIIQLTKDELFFAGQMGLQRQVNNVVAGKKDIYGVGADAANGWASHIYGAMGEWAVQKMIGRYQEPITDHEEGLPDVCDLQVRTTLKAENRSLILHPRDADNDTFMLVIPAPDPPLFNVVGTISGEDGKQQHWWRTDVRKPAFFVPIKALRLVS